MGGAGEDLVDPVAALRALVAALVRAVERLSVDSALLQRDFIHARTQGGSGGAALESYRAKVVEQFFSEKGGPGELRLGEARKAIRTYRKATGDLAGTVELLMTCVESGATLTHHYGDIDERFYRSVESVLNELAALLRGEARSMYPGFSDRLARVDRMAAGIGWGFCDAVADVVGQLREQHGGQ